MTDRVEKRIELKAPVARVWRALTDYREFGEWFRVKLDGPFTPGQVSRGTITHPGYEHVLTVTPTRAGTYSIICNEYCGINHHTMASRLYVVKP